jgi:DNA-binding transcriptional MerR regulator
MTPPSQARARHDEAAEGQELPRPAARRLEKSATAFRTISEVATELDVPQHVLRFWESRFPQVRPLKRGGGRRYYRPEDVDLLRTIRCLLYEAGYTIKGVQRLLREGTSRVAVDSVARATAETAVEATAESAVEELALEALAVEEPRAETAAPAFSARERSEIAAALDELIEARDRLGALLR